MTICLEENKCALLKKNLTYDQAINQATCQDLKAKTKSTNQNSLQEVKKLMSLSSTQPCIFMQVQIRDLIEITAIDSQQCYSYLTGFALYSVSIIYKLCEKRFVSPFLSSLISFISHLSLFYSSFYHFW